MPLRSHHYPSKILLVGEYSVMQGGEAFSIPYDKYFAEWKFGKSDFPSLVPLFEFVKSSQELSSILNIDAWEMDLEKNIFLDCNIPFGSGLGSSGVLCAAIYDRYAKVKTSDLCILQRELSMIESFFHGTSSGLDPLVSFCNSPIWLNTLEVKKWPIEFLWKTDSYEIELVNTHQERFTKKLVNLFKNKIENKNYLSLIENELMPVNSKIIESIIHSQNIKFIEYWKNISALSYNLFPEMIPKQLAIDWELGLKDDKYYYKLCGAGGGGFFLRMKILH